MRSSGRRSRVMRLSAFALGGLLVVVAGVAAAEVPLPEGLSGDRSGLTTAIGAFDATERGQRAFELGVAYRWPVGGWIHPIAGAMATSEGVAHVYAGFSLDLLEVRRVALRASFAPGYYRPGRRVRGLGHPIEFRSAVEVRLRLAGGRSIGIEYYHISNGGLGSSNPGAESVSLTLTFPLGHRPRERRPRPIGEPDRIRARNAAGESATSGRSE